MSVARLIKKAIVAALADSADVSTQVLYGPARDMDRECVYGGSIETSEVISAGRDATTGRTTRDVTGVMELHVRVSIPGGTVEDAEARADAIGDDLDDFLALNTPSSSAGDLNSWVQGSTLDSWYDDDGAYGHVTKRIGIQATIS